ncbi:MAG: hypothetical protein ACR2J1_01050 [Methyloceanibacter sp.]|uniref:hypothetical protein n=1 Tax=Methyloceanibacter sp. TaxID=1965321 RepID=UPI003D9AC018
MIAQIMQALFVLAAIVDDAQRALRLERASICVDGAHAAVLDPERSGATAPNRQQPIAQAVAVL